MPPSPMIGSIRIAGGRLADRRLDGSDVEGRDLVEPFGRRAEALEMLRLAAGGDGGERPAVERAFEGNEPIALGRAGFEVIAAGGLDGALDRFRAGIGEKRHVGEGGGAEPLGQTLLLGDAVQIGHMPQFLRLLVQSAHEMRMGMAERGHRHPARKVEIALAGSGEEIGAFPAREGKFAAGVGRNERRHESFAFLKTKLPPIGGSKESQSIRSPLPPCQSAPTKRLSHARPPFHPRRDLCSRRRSGRLRIVPVENGLTSVADACRILPDIVG